MTRYLFVATIDFNKLVNLDGLGAFISDIKAANKGPEASVSILTEVNERLPSRLKDEDVTVESIYVYYNIFVGVASLPLPESGDINDVTWQNGFIRPLMGAIFEPIEQKTDPSGMSYLTWVVAPVDNLIGGAVGAAGGGGRTIGNTGAVGNTGKQA